MFLLYIHSNDKFGVLTNLSWHIPTFLPLLSLNWTVGPELVDHRVLHHLLVVEPVLLQGVAVPHLEEPGQNGPGQRRLRLHLQARVGGPAGRARDDRHDAGEAHGGGHVCLNRSGNSITQYVYYIHYVLHVRRKEITLHYEPSFAMDASMAFE